MNTNPTVVDDGGDSLPEAQLPWQVDARFRYISVGGFAENHVGDHLGLTAWEWAAKAGASQEAAARIRKVFESGQSFTGLCYNIDGPDGHNWHLRQSGSPIEDASGKFAGYRGILVNETAEQIAGAMVDAIRAMPIGAMIWDRFDRLVAANDIMAAILAPVDKHLVPGISFIDLVRLVRRAGNPDAAANEIDRAVTEAFEAFDRKSTFETKLFGRWYWFSYRHLIGGGTLACATDVTDLKQTEAALRRSEELGRSIIETLREAVVVRDRAGKVVLRNSAAVDLNVGGAAPSEMMAGGTFEDGSPLTEDSSVWARTLASGEPLRDVLIRHVGDNGDLWLSINAAVARPTGDPADDVVVSSITDVTAEQAAAAALSASEQFYRTALETATEGILIRDMNGGLLYANAAAQTAFPEPPPQRLRPQDVAGLDLVDTSGGRFDFNDLPSARALRKREPVRGCVFGVRSGNGVKWLHQNAALLTRPGEEEPYAVVVSSNDITELHRHEEKIRDSEAFYRSILENVTEAIVVRDLDGSLLLANRAATSIMPVPKKLASLRSAAEVVDIDGQPLELANFGLSKALSRMEGETGIVFGDKSDGGPVRWLQYNTAILSRHGGKEPYAAVFSGTDVTQLREAQTLYRSILENASEGVAVRRMDGSLLLANPAWRRLFPYLSDQLDRRLGDDLTVIGMDGVKIPMERWPIWRALNERETVTGFLSGQTYQSGPTRWFSQNTSLLTRPGEVEPFAAVISSTDVTDLMRQQALVDETTSQTDAILENLMDGVVTIDEAGIVERFSKTAEAQFGYSAGEVIGQNVGMLMPEPYRSEHDGYLERYATTGESRIIGVAREVEGRRKDGTTFPLRLSVGKVKDAGRAVFFGSIHDLTDQRAREEQLLQAQKMEAVGQLAGGIAHDFGNMMAVAQLNMESLTDGYLSEGQADRVASTMRAISRSTELTQRLMAFSRPAEFEIGDVAVRDLLEGSAHFLTRSLGESISIDVDVPDDLWRVKANLGQLESALVNLAVNARDAMPHGGTLKLAASNRRLNEAEGRTLGDLAPGDYVAVEVADNGVGMTPQVLSKALDPFFTTKDVGRGTGLGLSTIYTFVRRIGGHVSLRSKEGTGTTVCLYLPRAKPGEAGEAENRGPEIERGNGQVILLVEDEDDLRIAVADLLIGLGYRVITAADAGQALARLAQNDVVDLLLTDVVLPGGLNGFELAAQVRETRPGLKVLFASGHEGDALTGSYMRGQGDTLLRKPFGRGQMAAAVHAVLTGPDRE